MGFLADFRSAAAAKATPEVDSRTATRRNANAAMPAATPEQQSDIGYYTPAARPLPDAQPSPAAEPSPAADIPYYAPPHSSDAPAVAPSWAPPESEDFPYYTPPTNGAVGMAPNWAPPLADGAPPFPGGAYPPPTRRPPMWIIGAVAAAVSVIAGVGAMFVLKSSPSLNGLTADQVMAKMVAAAHKAGTFHVEATESQNGSAVQMSMDIGASGGNVDASMGGHLATVRVVGGGVYLKGDAPALVQLGFADALAQQYADQWLSVPTNNADIQQLAQNLDTNQIIDQFLHLSGPLTRGSSGQGGVTIRGIVPDNQFNEGSGAGDTANLVVSNKEPFVPVSISFSDPTSGSTQMTFSRWGERVDIGVPPNAVTFAPRGATS